MGIGYVGQALVNSLVTSGYKTFGFDINKTRTFSINHELYSGLEFVEELEICDVIVICVPTPLDDSRRPDLSFLRSAISNVAKFRTKNQLVIVESTVAPGTLRNVVLPYFKMEGKTYGKDFFLAISPERVDPGNRKYTLENTPRIVAGLDKTATQLTTTFYSKFIQDLVIASSPEVAELAKMIENTFRLVNISLMNEIKGFADTIGADIWEAINVASTKPFAFMPHYPGPGVGGHCIPIDPVYLYEEAKNKGVDLDILGSAIKVNQSQPSKIVDEAKKTLSGRKNTKKAKMLLIGIAYKPESSDIRESPAVKIMEEAKEEGFKVTYFDPHVPKLNGYSSQILSREMLSEQDVIVIATHHENIQYELIKESGIPVIDTRNALKKLDKNSSALVEEPAS